MTSDTPSRRRRPRRDDGADVPFPVAAPQAPPGPDDDPRGRHATTLGQGFGPVVLWTILGAVVPGVGLIVSGNSVLGSIVLFLVAAVAVAGAAFVALGDLSSMITTVTTDLSSNLLLLAGGVGVLALLWFALVLGTHMSLRRFAHLTRAQGAMSALLVVGMTAVVALPAAQAAQDAVAAKDVIGAITDTSDLNTSTAQPSVSATDPWEDVARVNVLLIGSDAGDNRTGVRPDTLIVASINTKTGNTVLLSLPRNLQKVPFPEGTQMAEDYPEGYYCPEQGTANACMLNALWTFGTEHADTYYKDYKNPGLEATRSGVEQTLGLSIDNYVMINLDGFKQFINAIGGLTVYVSEKLPIGGNSEDTSATKGWLTVGKHHLRGDMVLWYARSRWSTSDYDRMRRQRCVIADIIQQASPTKIMTNLPKILKAVKSNLKTDITESQYSAWVTLAERVKNGKTTSLAFTDDVITTSDPDYAKIHRLTKQAIKKSNKTSSTSTGTSSSSSSASASSSASSSASNTMDMAHEDYDSSTASTAQDVTEVC